MTPQEKTKSKSELSPFAPLDIFHVRNFDLKVDIASLNNSDLESTDIALKLKCKNYLCKKGLFISKYQNGKSILTDFTITRDSKDSYKVTGNVNDVGYFAELYNISANIKDGRIYFDVNQELNHKSNEVIYEGNMKLKSDITIYENSALKALDADDMFLAIKGKIFSNNKTIFSRIKSEFIISPRLSIVNIKSLIANNLKIGDKFTKEKVCESMHSVFQKLY